MPGHFGLEVHMRYQTQELQREAKMLAVARHLKQAAPGTRPPGQRRFLRVLRGGIDRSPTAA